MFYVYVLSSQARKYIYVGLTNNLDKRIQQHQTGKNITTAAYRPFKLIFTEEFHLRPEARKREKYLKSGIGKEWIKNKFII